MTTPADRLTREDGRSAFGDGASAYHAVRSGYPPELYEHLEARAGPVEAILEIGPGSGLATEALMRLQPRRYIGVESDAGFVDFLRDRFRDEGVEFVCAPFPSGSVAGPFDLAVCAAAFHWLDPEPSLAALRDLLRPGGLWAMWWNSYLDETPDNPFAIAAMSIMRARGVRFPPSFGVDGHLALDRERQIGLLRANGFDDIEVGQWHHRRRFDPPAARAFFDSFSFVRLLPAAEREALLTALGALVSEQFGGSAELIVSTTCYTARPA